MRAALASTLIVALLIPGAAAAQQASGVQTASTGGVTSSARFPGAHLMTPLGREAMDDTRGTLGSDPVLRRLSFLAADGRVVFETPYERLTALHYERTDVPPRMFAVFGRSNHYLVIHATGDDGRPVIRTIRWLSDREVQPVLETVERHAGIEVDRSKRRESFLGLAIYVAPGDTIHVTGRDGGREHGPLLGLSAGDLTYAPEERGVKGQPHRIDEARVRRVALGSLASRHKTAVVTGTILGLFVGGLWAMDGSFAGASQSERAARFATCALGGLFIGYQIDRRKTVTVFKTK